METRLSSIAAAPSTGLSAAPRAVAAPQQPGFSKVFASALQSVSAAQQHAAGLQRDVQLESPKASLEETMVALQKAQLGFQATLHVRNRMVQAYTDIMNMQV